MKHATSPYPNGLNADIARNIAASEVFEACIESLTWLKIFGPEAAQRISKREPAQKEARARYLADVQNLSYHVSRAHTTFHALLCQPRGATCFMKQLQDNLKRVGESAENASKSGPDANPDEENASG